MKSAKSSFQKQLIGLSAILVLGAGCAKKEQAATTEVDAQEAAVESAVLSIGGAADDQEGASFAAYRTERNDKWNTIAVLLNPPARAAGGSCRRAIFESCNDGFKTIEYDSCAVGLGITITGSVQLAFSNTTCSLANTGDSVLRTNRATVSGPRGGSIQNSSADRVSSVDGTSIGGGSRLERTASGWTIDILGQHKVASTRNGRSLFDVSVKTAAPIQITGSLSRAGRIVNSGQVDVHHNLAKFKASFVPNQLQYSNTCCHPVSGSLGVTYSGSVTGNATVTFNGCGSATLTRGSGSPTSISLSHCE
jgi:hypothetical protein